MRWFNVLFLYNFFQSFYFLQEDQNRGKPNWEHLNDELHVLITVEDSENRAKLKLQRAVDEVKKLLTVVSIFFCISTFPSLFYDFFFLFPILPFQSEGEDELKKRQLMELAIINGTYRDSQSKNSSRKLKDKGVRSFLFTIKSVRSFLFTFHLQPALKPKGSW